MLCSTKEKIHVTNFGGAGAMEVWSGMERCRYTYNTSINKIQIQGKK